MGGCDSRDYYSPSTIAATPPWRHPASISDWHLFLEILVNPWLLDEADVYLEEVKYVQYTKILTIILLPPASLYIYTKFCNRMTLLVKFIRYSLRLRDSIQHAIYSTDTIHVCFNAASHMAAE